MRQASSGSRHIHRLVSMQFRIGLEEISELSSDTVEGFRGEPVMSKGRLDDLWNAIHFDGWVLLEPREMYTLVDGDMTWPIEHSLTKKKTFIQFYAFGLLGERTDSVADILYFMLPEFRNKAYFKKRGSAEWRQALAGFVEGLRSFAKENETGSPGS